MMHRYLVLGTNMGTGIAHALLQQEDTIYITLVDRSSTALNTAVNRLLDWRLGARVIDIKHTRQIADLIEQHDVTIGAMSYEANLALTHACIEAGKHFVDLGGNNTVVRKQLMLDQTAIGSGSKIVPDNGIAPGAASVLVHRGLQIIDEEGEIDSVEIRVGGLAQSGPEGPLNYSQLFAIKGLTNEYIEPTLVIRDGRLQTVDTMENVESIDFPEPYGRLEAAYTSGGLSTMPETLIGRVRNLDYKTLRYPGHWQKMQLLRDMGFLDEHHLITTGHGQVVLPRDFTEALLNARLPKTRDDALLLRITVRHGEKLVTMQLIDVADKETGLTAMQRTTGFSAAIVAMMLARGTIKQTGVMKLKESIPTRRFIQEWSKLGLHLEITRNF
ncbi:MAG: saccharopine dehydrogenase C-terminal domain-containing protein [Patescibacteria group bacterium]|nr:saccharopine dehydrogenase C-terminal domain-containing protein [Patescibacteria group bacterium]